MGEGRGKAFIVFGKTATLENIAGHNKAAAAVVVVVFKHAKYTTER